MGGVCVAEDTNVEAHVFSVLRSVHIM